MRFSLTKHARDVAKEREIPLEWVTRVIHRPERVEEDGQNPNVEHRLSRIREHQYRVLRVVINRKARPWRVITVYFDRTMRGKL